MKKIKLFPVPLIVLFSLLFIFACSEESSIVAPGNTSISSEEPNWISLPLNDNRLQKTFIVTKLITKRHGGKIDFKKSYKGGPHGEVKVSVKMKFPPNAVNEDTEFTMTLNDETGTISFSPSMTFNKDAVLTVEFKGIDLKGVNKKEVDFVYYNADGKYVSVDYKKLKVNIRKGHLKVEKAKIRHFSRYGFTK